MKLEHFQSRGESPQHETIGDMLKFSIAINHCTNYQEVDLLTQGVYQACLRALLHGVKGEELQAAMDLARSADDIELE